MSINIDVEPEIMSLAKLLKIFGHFRISGVGDGGHIGLYGHVVSSQITPKTLPIYFLYICNELGVNRHNPLKV